MNFNEIFGNDIKSDIKTLKNKPLDFIFIRKNR